MKYPEPYYQTSLGAMYLGDCRDIIPHIKADMVITDPDWILYEEALCLLDRDAVKRIAVRLGSCLNSEILWSIDKTYPFCRAISLRYPTYGRGGRLKIPRDKVFIFGNLPLSTKDQHMPNRNSDMASDHSCTRDLHFVSWLIHRCSDDDDIILDPFLASGTTAVACERVGRRWIGIEKDQKQCGKAIKRIEEEIYHRNLIVKAA